MVTRDALCPRFVSRDKERMYASYAEEELERGAVGHEEEGALKLMKSNPVVQVSLVRRSSEYLRWCQKSPSELCGFVGQSEKQMSTNTVPPSDPQKELQLVP